MSGRQRHAWSHTVIAYSGHQNFPFHQQSSGLTCEHEQPSGGRHHYGLETDPQLQAHRLMRSGEWQSVPRGVLDRRASMTAEGAPQSLASPSPLRLSATSGAGKTREFTAVRFYWIRNPTGTKRGDGRDTRPAVYRLVVAREEERWGGGGRVRGRRR